MAQANPRVEGDTSEELADATRVHASRLAADLHGLASRLDDDRDVEDLIDDVSADVEDVETLLDDLRDATREEKS